MLSHSRTSLFKDLHTTNLKVTTLHFGTLEYPKLKCYVTKRKNWQTVKKLIIGKVLVKKCTFLYLSFDALTFADIQLFTKNTEFVHYPTQRTGLNPLILIVFVCKTYILVIHVPITVSLKIARVKANLKQQHQISLTCLYLTSIS